MYSLILLTFLLAVTLTSAQYQQGQRIRPRQQQQYEEEELVPVKPKVYETHRHISPNIGDGNFQYSVETSDGLRAQQQGYLHRPQHSQVHEGSYTTFDETGQVVQVNYVADKDGFRVDEGSLPTPPPIPAEHLQATHDILALQKKIRDEHLGTLRSAYTARAA